MYRRAEIKEANVLSEIRQYELATAASEQEAAVLAQTLQGVPLILPYIESSTDVDAVGRFDGRFGFF